MIDTRNALELKQFVNQTIDGLISYMIGNQFKEYPQELRKTMIDCLNSLCNMSDTADRYVTSLQKKNQKELEQESEADWLWHKTFGGL